MTFNCHARMGSALLIFAILSQASAMDCDKWFGKSGLKPGTKNCEMDCALLDTDMGSFDCPSQCANLCKEKNWSDLLSK